VDQSGANLNQAQEFNTLQSITGAPFFVFPPNGK
jgi:hypothetical protein